MNESPANAPAKRPYVKILISVLLLSALVWVAKPFDALIQLSSVLPQMVVILFLGFVGVILFNGAAEWWLFRAFTPLTYARVMKYYTYSWSTELFLPGKLGMFSIAYFLHESEKIEIGKSVAVILLTKFAALLLLLGLGISGLVYYNLEGEWWMYGLIALAGMIGVFFIFFTPSGRGLIKKYVLKEKAVHFTGFSHVLSTLTSNPLRVIGLLAFLFCALATNAFAVQQLFIQAGYPLGYHAVLMMVSIVSLTGLIPITFNGLGLKEGALVALAVPLGVPADVAFSVAAMSTAVGYVIGFAISLAVVQHIPLNKIEGWWNARRNA